jgi:head-tail adaptor
MNFRKLNASADMLLPTLTKDAEGFDITENTVLAAVRAYREGRHGNENRANRREFKQ